MLSLCDLCWIVLWSRDLDVLRAQRIIGFFYLNFPQIIKVGKSDDMECIHLDQSESGFFKRKLDQIANQLEHLKSESGSVLTRMSLGRGYLEILVSGSCNQTAIDKSIEQSKPSLRYQSEWSASGGGSFGLQSKIGLRWNGMNNISNFRIQIGNNNNNNNNSIYLYTIIWNTA